jgi:hypothetical protein
MTLRLKLVHKKHEIQVAIPPHEAVKETFGDLKVSRIAQGPVHVEHEGACSLHIHLIMFGPGPDPNLNLPRLQMWLCSACASAAHCVDCRLQQDSSAVVGHMQMSSHGADNLLTGWCSK